MENRVVALSVLEDLIHWPLAPRDGSTAPNYSNFYLTGKLSNGRDPRIAEDDEDEDEEDELCFVAANAAGDQHLEPRARRQARYHAVLRLPLLCHKLGLRWVASEVVPYLLRCLEEEDPQLSFVVGLTLLGLCLPTPRAAASHKSSSSSSSKKEGRRDASTTTAFQSYLSLAEVRPVVEALGAARDPCTRHFAAQVVLPHLIFGTSLERCVRHSIGGWEGIYVPQWVLAEAVAQRGGGDGADADDSAVAQGSGAAGVGEGEDDDGGYYDRRMAEAYLSFMQEHEEEEKELLGSTSKKRNGGKVSAAPSAAAPDPLRLKEDFGFLTDDEFTSLCLAQRRDPVLAHCGLREASEASSVAGTSSREVRTKEAFLARVRACGGLTLLQGVPMSLFGATYAAERATSSCGLSTARRGSGGSSSSSGSGTRGPQKDYFYFNVQAHALVDDVTTWMDALAPLSAGASTTNAIKTPLRRGLRLSDYLSDEAPQGKGNDADAPNAATLLSRRAVLTQRWHDGIALLRALLTSQQPGAVAVAVETTAMLHHAMNSVLSGVDCAALGLADEDDDEDRAADPVVVARPRTPLRTEAELQAFQFYTTRRHIAFCLIAAHATAPVKGQSAAALSPSAVEVRRLMTSTMTELQRALHTLWTEAGVLVAMPMAPGEDGTTGATAQAQKRRLSLQFGPGPREARAPLLSAWDVCFSAHGAAATIAGAHSHKGGPVDVAHLLLTASGAADRSSEAPLVTKDGFTLRGALLYATENASSTFRQHRVVRMALLQALPTALDTHTLLTGDAAHESSHSTGTRLALPTVCRLLLEVLAPPSALPSLLSEMSSEAATLDGHDSNGAAARSPASPSVRLSSFTPAGEEETPASLDFGVMEAALSAVHRLLAEVAVSLPTLVEEAYAAASSTGSTKPTTSTTTSVRTADWRAADEALTREANRVLRSLFLLVQATTRAAAVYSSWKARWLLARKVPGLLAAYMSVVVRVGQAGQAAAERANAKKTAATGRPVLSTAWATSALPTLLSPWYYHAVKLLTALWGPSVGGSTSAASGGSPATLRRMSFQNLPQQHHLNSFTLWMEDEEPEVRIVAVPCAAACADVMAQSATRIAACVARHKGTTKPPPRSSSSNVNFTDSESIYLAIAGYAESYPADLIASLGPLLQPLVALTEAVIGLCEVALQDRLPPVRCAGASALSAISRTLSALCTVGALTAYTPPSTSTTRTSSNPVVALPAAVGEGVWKSFLAKATEALLTLMSDSSSTVQLTLVAELADLLVTAPTPAPATAAAATGEAQDNTPAPTAAQVRHTALLSCLGSLAKHDVWRFRERYAVLLCEMIAKFLTPRYLHATPPAGERAASMTMATVAAATTTAGATADSRAASVLRGASLANASVAADEGTGAESTGWAHTHPLFRLAREELLPMLVTVLFDKVKAVRDAALEATAVMCSRLNAAAAASSVGEGGSGGGASGSAGAGAGGVSLEERARSVSGRRSVAGSSVAAAGDATTTTAARATVNANRFVNDVLWPLIKESPKAWETYLSRSSLLRVAVRLRVDKVSLLLPLLDQLAHDSVLNVRLVVAKTIHDILTHRGASGNGSGSGSGSTSTASGVFSPTGNPTSAASPRHGRTGSLSLLSVSSPRAATSPGAFRTNEDSTRRGGEGGSETAASSVTALPPLMFTEEEKNGVVVDLLRQLLEDTSADVRDEAARALKVCF